EFADPELANAQPGLKLAQRWPRDGTEMAWVAHSGDNGAAMFMCAGTALYPSTFLRSARGRSPVWSPVWPSSAFYALRGAPIGSHAPAPRLGICWARPSLSHLAAVTKLSIGASAKAHGPATVLPLPAVGAADTRSCASARAAVHRRVCDRLP